jgi:hypothetical protein
MTGLVSDIAAARRFAAEANRENISREDMNRPLGLEGHAVPMRLARGARDWRAVRGLMPALLILPFAEEVTFRPLGPDEVRLAPPLLWLAFPLDEPLGGPAVLLFVDADGHGLAVELMPADIVADHDEQLHESFQRPGTSPAPFRS